jgi:hypothetical protein
MAFPVDFPAPRQPAYLLTRKPQVIETEMEAGPTFSRRVSTVRRHEIQIELVITSSQVDEFQDWFDDSAGGAGGAAWFTGLLLDLGDGNGLRTTVECKIIGGAYEIAPHKSTLNWTLKFTVATR